MNRIIGNSIINILSKVWSFLSLYIFVPLWIKYVGVEGYGVISFYTILMTLMHFADAGLSATLTREFAKTETHRGYRQDLLKTFEVVYILISLLVSLFIFSFSEYIVDNFLKSQTIDHSELIYCVKIMAVILAFNFMDILYGGGLAGLQKQVLNGILTITYGLLRSAIVLIPLMFYPSVKTFLFWQLGSIIVICIIRRYFTKNSVRLKDVIPQVNFKYFKNIWKYALGMMAMAMIYALNTQMDKLITGKLLSLESLGYYALAGTIGSAVGFLSQPLTQAIFPELTNLVSVNKKDKLKFLFLIYTFILSAVSAVIGITLLFYTKDFFVLWLGSESSVEYIDIPAKLLLIGNMLSALQCPPFYLGLAYGHNKTNVFLGAIMLLLSIPSVYLLTQKYGLNATAVPFCILNFFATIYLGVKLVRKFLPDGFYQWGICTFLPILSTFVLSLLGYILIDRLCDKHLIRLFIGTIINLPILYIQLKLLIRLLPNAKQIKLISKFI